MGPTFRSLPSVLHRCLFTALLAMCTYACGQAPEVNPRVEASTPTSTAWTEVVRNDTLSWYLDSATLVYVGRGTRVWIAVVAPESDSVPSYLSRFETRQELDCERQVARGLDVRTPDPTGKTFVTAVRDSTWVAFATHSLPADVLHPVCTMVKLRGLSSTRRDVPFG